MASGDWEAAVEPAPVLARSIARMLHHWGYTSLTELSLRSGRRTDVTAINARGHIIIIEIKRSIADFRSDQKWPEYLDYCDAYYFATPLEFPMELIPEECGVILADRFGAEMVRPTELPQTKLHASRRKEVTLRFARVAARRLGGLIEAGAEAPTDDGEER